MPLDKLPVLLVEDDPMVRRSIEMLLVHLGHTVETAGNGDEALRRVSAAEYGVILVDLYMPGMMGDELARQIKQRKPHVSIILITGSGSLPPQPEFSGVLRKPFALDDLRETLRLALLPQDVRLPHRVVVSESGAEFQIQTTGLAGEVHSQISARDQVVHAVAGVLNAQLPGHRAFDLQAPDWIRSELRQRGFEL